MPESQSTFLIGGYKALTLHFWCNFEDRLELQHDDVIRNLRRAIKCSRIPSHRF